MLDEALVLTIDPAYFPLTGGIERWLYVSCASTQAASREAGSSISGICIASRRAFRRSSASPLRLRHIARRQPFPGYRLGVDPGNKKKQLHTFVSTASLSTGSCGQAVGAVVLSGTPQHVPSGTASSCYQEPENGIFIKPIKCFRAA